MRDGGSERLFSECEKALSLTITASRAFPSGMSGQVWGIECQDARRLVLKSYPGRFGGAAALRREWQGLTELSSAGINVPRPIFFKEDGADPWFAMEWIEGQTFVDAWKDWDDSTRHMMARALLELIEATHTALVPSLLAGAAAESASFVRAELASCREALASLGQGGLSPIAEWLDAGLPGIAALPVGLVIRDLHPWNVLVGEGKRLFLIDLDWTVGDPRYDLAWMLNTLEMGKQEEMKALISGMIDARPEGRSGGMGYFSVLARFRWFLDVLISMKTRDSPSEDDRTILSGFLRATVERLAKDTGLSDISLEAML